MLEYFSPSISQIIDGTSLMLVIIIVTKIRIDPSQQWWSYQDLLSNSELEKTENLWMVHSLIFHRHHDIVGHPFVLGTCLSVNMIPTLQFSGWYKLKTKENEKVFQKA